MTPLDWFAVALIAGVPWNWSVALFQARLSDQHPDVSTLQSRAVTQITCAVITSIGGVLGAMELTGLFALTTILLAAAFVLAYLPGIYWTVTYFRGGFE